VRVAKKNKDCTPYHKKGPMSKAKLFDEVLLAREKTFGTPEEF